MSEDPRGLPMAGSRTAAAPAIERRREARYETCCEAMITLLGAGSRQEMEGHVVEVSKSGLRIEISRAVSAGSKLRVAFGDTLAFGTVPWCGSIGHGRYEAGVRIDHTVPRRLVDHMKSGKRKS